MSRTVPALELVRNPLVCVLAQIKIAPVLSMSGFLPPIQEQLRQSGYPMFQTIEQEEIVIGARPIVRRSTQWAFIDKNGLRGIVLSPAAITLQVTSYSKFEEFTASLSAALKIIGEAAKLSLVERIGLRYVNRICPEAGESLDQYLQPGILGLPPEKIGTSKGQLKFEQRGDTALGKLLIRLFQNEAGDLPPGVEPFGLTLPPVEANGGVQTILDVDHFSARQRDFEPNALMADMWKLHEFTDRAFRAAITDYALNKWRKK